MHRHDLPPDPFSYDCAVLYLHRDRLGSLIFPYISTASLPPLVLLRDNPFHSCSQAFFGLVGVLFARRLYDLWLVIH